MKKCLNLYCKTELKFFYMKPREMNVAGQEDGRGMCNVCAIDELKALYRETFGAVPCIVGLPSAGSDRRYFRLGGQGLPVVVGTWSENVVENRAFIGLAKAFSREGLPVPAIYVESESLKAYLQEDFGDVALLSLLQGEDKMRLAEESLCQLVKMQTVDEGLWKPLVMNGGFSARQVMWDLNYFKYDFVKPCGIVYDEDGLEDDFERLSHRLCSISPDLMGFMYRDFQSRNVMVRNGDVHFIDFQGGRKGPLLYDAVSFLWQAKAGFTEEERHVLLGKYAEALSKARGVDADKILEDCGALALFRTLQVLGAYGFRGLIEKRAHFIESIPFALENLGQLVMDGEVGPYPELKKIVESLLQSRFAKMRCGGSMVVEVFSFSYKRGYPEDLTGNGGGFMFDCRGMHNPGRYLDYKDLTGLDAPVKRFLEERGEVQEFVSNALKIVSPTVDCYIKRGFSNLQVGFGCTGGRHRSVYCAESFAREISTMFPCTAVRLEHREQGVVRMLNENTTEVL